MLRQPWQNPAYAPGSSVLRRPYLNICSARLHWSGLLQFTFSRVLFLSTDKVKHSLTWLEEITFKNWYFMIVVIWVPYLPLKIIFPSFLVCHFSFIFFCCSWGNCPCAKIIKTLICVALYCLMNPWLEWVFSDFMFSLESCSTSGRYFVCCLL